MSQFATRSPLASSPAGCCVNFMGIFTVRVALPDFSGGDRSSPFLSHGNEEESFGEERRKKERRERILVILKSRYLAPGRWAFALRDFWQEYRAHS